MTHEFKTTNFWQSLKAHVLHDGHIDHITGPRCLVQMDEGDHYGKYRIVHTQEVFMKGEDVMVDWRGHAARI